MRPIDTHIEHWKAVQAFYAQMPRQAHPKDRELWRDLRDDVEMVVDDLLMLKRRFDELVLDTNIQEDARD